MKISTALAGRAARARLSHRFSFGHPVARAVLAVGALLTLAATFYVDNRVQSEQKEYFERRAAEARDLLSQRLRLNLELLRGLQGLFVQAGERPLARGEFRRYVDHLDLYGRYAGVQALSFTRYVAADALAAYEAGVRADPSAGRPDFAVKPVGARGDYLVVDFVAPDSPDNAYAFGLDLGVDPVRRDTFERARDSGTATVSRRVILTMRPSRPAGFFVAAPVYRAGAPLTTVEERRRAFLGCVTAVFRSHEMFTGLFGRELLKELDIEIYDLPDGAGKDAYNADSVLFDSAVEVSGHVVALHSGAAGFDRQRRDELKISDHQWTVVFTALPTMGAGQSRQLLALFTFGAGSVLTLLLCALAASVANATRRLEAEVAERTAALAAANADLTASVEQLTLLNRELEAAQRQLLQSEKMAAIGQLAAGVAHEINNPISFISSNLATLRQQVADLLLVVEAYARADGLIAGNPVLAQAIAHAKKAADLDFLRQDLPVLIDESQDGVVRVRDIVRDLKNFSHVDSAEWAPASLEAGLDSTLNIVWNELKYKAEVVKEYGGVPDVECLGSQLNQVFMNLLVNAAHAIDERGTITLRTGCASDEVWVEIADTGKGIAPEHLNRVFEPFFTTKPVGQGTGLGLSLAYSIVERHHGRIEVASEPGRGTRFRVTVPRRHAPAETAAAAA